MSFGGGVSPLLHKINVLGVMVGVPGIEPGVRLREGVTVPCHTLRPVAHCRGTGALRREGVITGA